MGSASSMLTQYDIEEVEKYCNTLFSRQEIVSLYHKFCQLDRNAKGFISADEFLSVPEFAVNPLSQRILKMVDGLNFKDFVAFLSAFSDKASPQQKIERMRNLPSRFYKEKITNFKDIGDICKVIFKVHDSDHNGKVSLKNMLEVLKDLSGPFISDEQREQVLRQLLKEAGYSTHSYLGFHDFIQVIGQSNLKMYVEVPVE